MDQTVIIAINSGVGLRMIGNTGQYVKEFTDAMKFADEIEAYEYIERHGLEKLSSVDGEDITYINWLSGEPTYYDEDGFDENYLMVFKVNGVWYFNDATNDVSMHYSGKMGYIVEVEE